MRYLGCLFQILFIAAGIVQFFAVSDGLALYFHLGGFASGALAFIVTYIPILGMVVGAYGAHDAWYWSWGASIALVAWPLVPAILVSIVAAIAAALRK